MTYTGDVTRTGASDVRETDQLVIRKAEVSEQGNNAYLLTCRRTGAQVLIDAADDSRRVLELVREGSPESRLETVVTTHRHWDHHRALPDVVQTTGAHALAGAADADKLPVEVHTRLEHGDTVPVGDVELQVIHLRGHTPGSVALLHHDDDGSTHLFTGDSLFPGGVGKTGSREDFASLIDDVESRVFGTLPDETWVYPGHGADTTLGVERPKLGEWRERGW